MKISVQTLGLAVLAMTAATPITAGESNEVCSTGKNTQMTLRAWGNSNVFIRASAWIPETKPKPGSDASNSGGTQANSNAGDLLSLSVMVGPHSCGVAGPSLGVVHASCIWRIARAASNPADKNLLVKFDRSVMANHSPRTRYRVCARIVPVTQP